MIRMKCIERNLRRILLFALVITRGVGALPTGLNPEILQQLKLPLETALEGEIHMVRCDALPP